MYIVINISSGTNKIGACPKKREFFERRKFLPKYSGSVAFNTEHNLIWRKGWWSGNE